MSKSAVLPTTPAWTLGTRPCKRFSGVCYASSFSPPSLHLARASAYVVHCQLCLATGEVQPGPGEYALASHYEVCSTATREPSFSIPGGRGLGSSKASTFFIQQLVCLLSILLGQQTVVYSAFQTSTKCSGERTPGPSDYKSDSNMLLPGKPAYTIAGRQSQGMHRGSTPGPSAYAVRGNSKLLGSHPNAPGYSMPSSGRMADPSHKAPGPGGGLLFVFCLVVSLSLDIGTWVCL